MSALEVIQMNTPWGKSDGITKIQRGVSWVTTPGHGGLAVSEKAGHEFLTVWARGQAEFRYGYYFFEEDCAYAIAFYEQPDWYRFLTPLDRSISNFEIREKMLPIISQYMADYLIARGITPEPVAYAHFLEHKAEDKMRKNNSPELIVAAWGDWADWVPQGKTGIETAAGTRFLVNSADYARNGYRMSAYPNAIPINVLLTNLTDQEAR